MRSRFIPIGAGAMTLLAPLLLAATAHARAELVQAPPIAVDLEVLDAKGNPETVWSGATHVTASGTMMITDRQATRMPEVSDDDLVATFYTPDGRLLGKALIPAGTDYAGNIHVPPLSDETTLEALVYEEIGKAMGAVSPGETQALIVLVDPDVTSAVASQSDPLEHVASLAEVVHVAARAVEESLALGDAGATPEAVATAVRNVIRQRIQATRADEKVAGISTLGDPFGTGDAREGLMEDVFVSVVNSAEKALALTRAAAAMTAAASIAGPVLAEPAVSAAVVRSAASVAVQMSALSAARFLGTASHSMALVAEVEEVSDEARARLAEARDLDEVQSVLDRYAATLAGTGEGEDDAGALLPAWLVSVRGEEVLEPYGRTVTDVWDLRMGVVADLSMAGEIAGGAPGETADGAPELIPEAGASREGEDVQAPAEEIAGRVASRLSDFAADVDQAVQDTLGGAIGTDGTALGPNAFYTTQRFLAAAMLPVVVPPEGGGSQ